MSEWKPKDLLYIAHRGNLNGPEPSLENLPEYIEAAISAGYDVEIDVRVLDGWIFLGHDSPDYRVEAKWLQDRYSRLWIHAKNIEAVEWLAQSNMHWFWHKDEAFTITSFGYLWVHPKTRPMENSICVMPELENITNFSHTQGVCSDYIKRIRNENSDLFVW